MAILIFHNLVRWFILLFGIWTVVNALIGLISKSPFSKKDKMSGLFFMICCDIQLLLGLILIFSNGWVEKMKSGMGALMKNSTDRFFIVEHGFMMIIAWILVHIGYSAVKKASPENKHKKMLIYFGIALLLILVSIPFSYKGPEIARPLFRGFN
jgi:hypothetical protein